MDIVLIFKKSPNNFNDLILYKILLFYHLHAIPIIRTLELKNFFFKS